MYATAITAAYACAIHVVATRFERQRFDAYQPLPVPFAARVGGRSAQEP